MVDPNISAQRTIKVTRVSALVLWIWIAGWAWATESKPHGRATPLWAARLAEADDGNKHLKKTSPLGRESAGVTFLDDERLIVFNVDRTGELPSRVSPEVSSSFRLHSVVFDAGSGKVAFTKDWGTRAHDSSIRVTNGGLLVRTGPEIKFYSKNFVELQHVLLPDARTSVVSVSTTGRTVLLNHYDQKESHFEARDGNTFELRKSWSEAPPLRHLYSISDVAIAAADSDQKHIILGDFGTGRWRTLESNGNSKVGCVYSPTFISERLLASAICGKLMLLSTGGATLMEDHPEKDESEGEKIEVARDGRVIAASLVRRKGGGFFDTDVRRIGDRVAVYDLSLKKRILTVDVDPLPKNDYDFTLSPDGSKLAILNDRNVSVYSVPLQPAEHADTVDPKDGTLRLQLRSRPLRPISRFAMQPPREFVCQVGVR